VKQIYNFPLEYKQFSFYFENPLSSIFMEVGGLAKPGMGTEEIVLNWKEDQ
jgi:hypothetical protein